jgi:hypothetical protein
MSSFDLALHLLLFLHEKTAWHFSAILPRNFFSYLTARHCFTLSRDEARRNKDKSALLG